MELRDYSTVEGTYDKIVSVGMFEHIGLANMKKYFNKINSLLRDRGILLPADYALHRIIGEQRKLARQEIFCRIGESISDSTRKSLDDLLNGNPLYSGSRQIPPSHLPTQSRHSPTESKRFEIQEGWKLICPG